MSNTQNIFACLSDNEDSDVDTQQRTQNKEKRIRTRGKKQIKAPGQQEAYPEKSQKELNKRNDHRGNQQRGGPRQRSKDRQSGTGISGVQRNHYRKGGAGKGNLGTIKDDLQRQPQVEEDEEEEEEEEQVEDNTMTLEQYLQNKGKDLQSVLTSQEQARQREVDEKQLQQQLKKDKLELVQKKPEREQQQTTKGSKQGYKPVYQGEGADLIGFRTGFVAEKKKEPLNPPLNKCPKTDKKKFKNKLKNKLKNNLKNNLKNKPPKDKKNNKVKEDNTTKETTKEETTTTETTEITETTETTTENLKTEEETEEKDTMSKTITISPLYESDFLKISRIINNQIQKINL